MSNKYHTKSYWQQRYQQTTCENYEWLSTASQMLKLIQPYLPTDKTIPILELGCGSSSLAAKISQLGYSVTAVDFSKDLIKHMQKNKSGVKYMLADISSQLPFEAGSFGVIVDKNSIDCLFCEDGYFKLALKCMMECFRVLSAGGVLVSVTSGKPQHRKVFYRNKLAPFASLNVISIRNIQSGDANRIMLVCHKDSTHPGSDDDRQQSRSNSCEANFDRNMPHNQDNQPSDEDQETPMQPNKSESGQSQPEQQSQEAQQQQQSQEAQQQQQSQEAEQQQQSQEAEQQQQSQEVQQQQQSQEGQQQQSPELGEYEFEQEQRDTQ